MSLLEIPDLKQLEGLPKNLKTLRYAIAKSTQTQKPYYTEFPTHFSPWVDTKVPVAGNNESRSSLWSVGATVRIEGKCTDFGWEDSGRICFLKFRREGRGAKPMPKLADSIIEHYRGVGKLLSKYISGKIPKAFKYIHSLQVWEEVLYLTEPEKWSPDAMYQATRIFASNMDVKKVERFYKFVLLPRVREDIRNNRSLPFALYQSLKKAL
ncbi:bystin-like protein [Perilla frutescens var. hirtella]|uniref:Bystin-like protein n=1 Tax=Perilla frutescens var. hirtella TaxID=608512 RepID=A0AAD4JQH0_PERFH|nr:bystin-like protein [Perilla frutescens var. hirtella]